MDNALVRGELRKLKDSLAEEKVYPQNETHTARNFEGIVEKSVPLQEVLRQIEVVAPTDSGVIIQGETGTGKELIARAIHNLSARRDRPFIKLNCAAIPSGLLESEHVLRGLHESNWVIAGPRDAAARLGMRRTTLAYRIRKLKITCRPQ